MAYQSLKAMLTVLVRCFRVCRSVVIIAYEVGSRRCWEIIDEEYDKGDVYHGALVVVPEPEPILPLANAGGVVDECLHQHTTRMGSNMHKRRTTCLDCGRKWVLPA